VSAEGDLCPSCRTERVPDAVDAEELFPSPPEDATAITVIPYELRPRFTGRKSAVERVLRAFDEARDKRELQFLIVIGEPGMGKSRLIKEATRSIKAKDLEARFLTGSGDGRGVGFAAFAQVLSQRFGITAADTPEDQQEKIIAGVAEVLAAQRVTEVAHLLAHMMRVPFRDSAVVGPLVESPQQLEARTYIAMRRFLAADADQGPLLLCFENLELCGPETSNLLHYLAAGLAGSPVLMVGTARASLYDKHPSFGEGDVPVERIDLGPLEDEEAIDLLKELCRPLDEVPPVLLSHATKLKGSPRGLFELMRLLLEAEVIIRSGSMSWQIDPLKLKGMRLPEDHEALLAERLRVMAPAERDLLEKAAAVGETFWLDSVVALVRVAALKAEDPDGPTLGEIAQAGDHTRVSVAQTLAKLVEREWVIDVTDTGVPGEREYRFAYPQLWASAYESIDESTRRKYHKLVALWLELRPAGRAAVAQEDVARHLELAGDANGAAARYRRAADAARRSFFNDKAIRLYARALACIGEHDLAARIHLWHDLGSVYELKGDFEAALGAFERMLRLSWVVASRTKAAVAFNKMGRVWRRKGDLKLALEYLARGQELFEQSLDARGIAGSLDDIGHVLYLLGRYDEAYEKVTKGLAARGRRGDKRSIAHSLSNLGNIQQMRGRFPEARNCHTEALDLRRAIGDRAGVIASLNNLAVLAFEVGDYEAARKGWEQALDEAEDIGALPLQALALANLGELALIEGRHEEARSRIEDALEISEDIDDRRLTTEALRNLALLEHATGGERAVALGERALEIARSAGLRDNEGRCLVALGEVVAGNLFDADKTDEMPRDGELTSAESYYRRGLDLLRDIGNESELAKALERFGRYKVERGEIAAGKSLLQEALTIFSRLGMHQTSDVEKVLTAL
jgi:tetratricopeptide (TPR) repeat protein